MAGEHYCSIGSESYIGAPLYRVIYHTIHNIRIAILDSDRQKCRRAIFVKMNVQNK